mgnify:CR=1 FL=1
MLNSDASTTFSLSASEFVLVEENIGKDALTATWTEPDFGYTAGPNYMVVFSTTEKSKAVSAGSNLSKVFETEELNKILIGLDLLPNTSAEINVQLKVVLSEYSEIAKKVVIKQLLTAAVNKCSGDQIFGIPLENSGGVATSIQFISLVSVLCSSGEHITPLRSFCQVTLML